MGRNENLRTLAALSRQIQRGPAVEAVRAGQGVLAAGLRARIPVLTGRLLRSLRVSRVGARSSVVHGSVFVTAPYARPVEKMDHYMRQTASQEGPRVLRAISTKLIEATR